MTANKKRPALAQPGKPPLRTEGRKWVDEAERYFRTLPMRADAGRISDFRPLSSAITTQPIQIA